ncbi:Uncharacterised protein [Serratia ficaria]|nr:Uncharacterised protein [Serratia ficaria]
MIYNPSALALALRQMALTHDDYRSLADQG